MHVPLQISDNKEVISNAIEMSSSKQITEIAIFHLKEGVSLENVVSSNPSVATQAFIKLVNIITAQNGFMRQFWVFTLYDPLSKYRR